MENTSEKSEVNKLDKAEIQELYTLLKTQAQEHLEQAVKTKDVLEQLQIVGGDNDCLTKCRELIQTMESWRQEMEVESTLSATSIALANGNYHRKNQHYVITLKMCLRLYKEINASVQKRTKFMELVVQNSQLETQQIPVCSSEELKKMEDKIKRYESQLSRLENRHLWLKKSDYDVPSIAKEAEKLKILQTEKQLLMKELSGYHGLQPDIGTAFQQIEEIKAEYQELCNSTNQ